jgi:ADP-heptose:LPS heptosyltransferase
VHAHTSDIANFVDTAALIEQMDAVVTIDTSVAHLAGALAKPTFVMLPPACDYRWTRDAAVSPWYPTSSLHRRPIGGTWREPVETIRDLLGS